MIKINRQEAKKQGLPTCYGSVCLKHPELEGLRRVSGACIECARLALKQRRVNKKDLMRVYSKTAYEKQKADPVLWAKKLAADKEYRKANREKVYAMQAEWSKRNPEKVKATAKRNRQNNKAMRNANTVKRRLSKLNRTPAWLTDIDYERIQNEYKLAVLLTKVEGVQWTVDHIIPLQGELVSGLHVPSNLQVMRASENYSKRNKFEVTL